MRDMTMFIRIDTNAYNRDQPPTAQPRNEMNDNGADTAPATTRMTTTSHTTTQVQV